METQKYLIRHPLINPRNESVYPVRLQSIYLIGTNYSIASLRESKR